MLNKIKIIQESREFFDLKNKLQIDLEDYEKQIYSESKNLSKIYNTLYELKSFIRQTNSEYFKLKIETLETLLNKITTKREYHKIEFDRAFKTLEKIKETESSEFLNSAIQNRIQKISEKILNVKAEIKTKQKDLLYSFTYNGLDYLVKGYPKKILFGVDESKKFLRIKTEKYPIFPLHISNTKSENFSLCNLLILKVRTKNVCFKFQKMEEVFDISYSNLQKKLIKLDITNGDINSYFRYKGKRLYFIDI